MSESNRYTDMADEYVAPTMRCPHCASTDVACHENTRRHVHECNACGHKDIYRGSADV